MVFHDKGVLFVCLGNICVSPIAEAVLKSLLMEKNLMDRWLVDSAGLVPWHTGSQPDPRTVLALRNKQMETKHVARQIESKDFEVFDYILGMDEDNLADLKRIKPADSKSTVGLLGDFDPAGDKIIDDPYFTQGDKAFNKTLEHCRRACEGFLKAVL